MNDKERQDLVARYSSLTDDSLLAALTSGRDQYRADVRPLLEVEARKRNLSVPALTELPQHTSKGVSTHMRLPHIVSQCFARLHWKRLTWVGKGYMVILVLMILPFVCWGLVYAVAAILGCEIVGHYLETGGEVPRCLIMGVNISPPLHAAYAIVGWWAILSVIGCPGLAFCFTVFALLKWCWRKLFSRSRERLNAEQE
jgi:hypothetical protein